MKPSGVQRARPILPPGWRRGAARPPLDAGPGHDPEAYGSYGVDEVRGGTGADDLYGGSGEGGGDILRGKDGDDHLDGSVGPARLYGDDTMHAGTSLMEGERGSPTGMWTI